MPNLVAVYFDLDQDRHVFLPVSLSLPPNGFAGTVLLKLSDTDGNYAWSFVPIDSVNGLQAALNSLSDLLAAKLDASVVDQNGGVVGISGLGDVSVPRRFHLNPGETLAFANNAAALAAGLVPGDVYRSGNDPDTLCMVD